MSWWLYNKSTLAPLRPIFWTGLALKLMASTTLGFIYTYYYTYQGDTYLYFNDGAQLSKLAFTQPKAYLNILLFNKFEPENINSIFSLAGQPRAFYMAKFVSLINLFTWNNYWISGWYVSLLSFYGCWKLANTLASIFPGSKLAAGMAFLLFPSVVFWSSGLMKETIAMACITGSLHLLLAYQFHLYTNISLIKKLAHSFFILLSCFILWKIKYYYLGALLPVSLTYVGTAYFLQTRYPAAKPIIQLLIFFICFAGMLIGATQLDPNLHINSFLHVLLVNHDGMLPVSSPEDLIHYKNLQATPASLLENMPLALVSGLFRPFIWEGNTVFQWLTGFENFIILLLTMYALIPTKSLRISRQPACYLLLVSAILYILFLAMLMAFSSPNFGTLSRYKIGFLPFLLYLIILAAHRKIVTNKPFANSE